MFSTLALFLALATAHAFADGERQGYVTELGVTGGLPASLNVNLGLWLPKSSSLVFRISGGYYDKDIKGLQAEAGYVFDREGTLRQSITLGAITYRAETSTNIFSSTISQFSGIGPVYSLDWHGITLRMGAFYGYGNDYYQPFLGAHVLEHYRGVRARGQLGYVWLID